MKFLFVAMLLFAVLSFANADTADSMVKGMSPLGVKMREMAPVLDKLMERNLPDERFPQYSVWTLYGQNDTSVYLTYDSEGNVYGGFFQFYLGHDNKREEHYHQCLPIARFLILSLMREQKPSLRDIDNALRDVDVSNAIKTYREKDRVMYFRYKKATFAPELEDGYRCFRIEIGGPDREPSTDT